MGNVVVNERYIEMMNNEIQFLRAKDLPKHLTEKPDTRYNVPKSEPKASDESIDKTIMETEIYRRTKIAILQAQPMNPKAKEIILQAQRKQVAYGIDKYPESLNPNTWSTIETIDHIIDESIDKLHYQIMLGIKMEQGLVGKTYDNSDVESTWAMIETVDGMVNKSIQELYCVVRMRIKLENEVVGADGEGPNMGGTSLSDAIDNVRYAAMAFKEAAAGADFDGDTLPILDNEYLKRKLDMKNSDIVGVSPIDDNDALALWNLHDPSINPSGGKK